MTSRTTTRTRTIEEGSIDQSLQMGTSSVSKRSDGSGGSASLRPGRHFLIACKRWLYRYSSGPSPPQSCSFSSSSSFSIFDRRSLAEVCAEQRRIHELRQRMPPETVNKTVNNFLKNVDGPPQMSRSRRVGRWFRVENLCTNHIRRKSRP